MDKSAGQSGRPTGARSPASAGTRERLLTAAAELIAELGWGRVTTRAVAERAGLPHGAVSYHFSGKQALLVEAALHTFAEALPMDAFTQLASVADLLTLIRAEIGEPDAPDPTLSRLMFETMREAERDTVLREHLGTMLRSYREVIVTLVTTEQRRGTVARNVPADALATLLAALGDGLMLHVLLDPTLDIAAAVDAMTTLVTTRPGPPHVDPEIDDD